MMINITQIEQNVANLFNSNIDQQTFIYDFLLAFGLPKASIARLQKGNLNLAKADGEILWKKKLYFKPTATAELYQTIENIRNNPQLLKNDPRFVIVTDYQQLLALDTKTLDTLDIGFNQLAKHFDFFLPWAGMEKATYQGENPADVKAAEKMAKLFDEIRKDNPEFTSKEQLHSLNVFLSRLLFCFFAEDTAIFSEKQFTNAVKNYTQLDGSDVHQYLDKIFAVMNQKERANLPDYIAKFPYVNGGLFRDSYPAPKFSFKSRQLLLESGDLDWSVINPDIFGSMMQAVVDAKQRSGLGMHYTSVPNIMKVIEPLFLNELKEEFSKVYESKAKLEKLLARIAKIKIFDPACGSGNFLIIAYKELRSLEISIMQRIDELTGKASMLFSQIQLHNFYGIEIDDFAHEIAKLSLWLAEHQMNLRFEKEFGRTLPPLPLKDSGNIVCANACRIDWEGVCPKSKDDEIYILGNPPYLGSNQQDNQQKQDMEKVFSSKIKLDYISSWILKASNYIKGTSFVSAFVSTNSICQGEQVELLWTRVLSLNVEIKFAYKSIKWGNNAKNKAAVTVIIIGLIDKQYKKNCFIFEKNKQLVKNITPYLTAGNNVIVRKRNKPLNISSELVYGNQAIDGGHLELSSEEKNYIIEKYPHAERFIRRLYGGNNLLSGEKRWCIWVNASSYEEASHILPFKERFYKVECFRKNGGQVASSLVNISYRFRYTHEHKEMMLILPKVSSVNRCYIPIAVITDNSITLQTLQVIYDPEMYVVGLLMSKIHNLWVKYVAGYFENHSVIYSNSLCYNTFPFPNISEDQKKRIEMYVFDVLDEREKHPEKTLAELYDPDKMPDGLRQAHHNLDIAIEQCYRLKPFASDEERLEHLFSLYEQMTSGGIK